MKSTTSSLIIFFLIITTVLYGNSIERTWLESPPTHRFLPLTELSTESPEYRNHFMPYLIARGVQDEAHIKTFFYKDLYNIAQALSILFDIDSKSILQNLFGSHFFLIEGCSSQIDHVGRELFGPISCYLPLLEQIAPLIGLIKANSLVFPSTQVVKVLQEEDPTLSGVTIGRVYFQNLEDGRIRCLELFQASMSDDSSPQRITATEERIALLTALISNSTKTPIDHISIELTSVEEVQKIHNLIHQLSSDTLKPYQSAISYNPGDGSTQTKVLLRDSNESPFNKIVEFVYYARRAEAY